jgi:hypothetical protein
VRKLFILLGRLFRCSHTGITLKLGAPPKSVSQAPVDRPVADVETYPGSCGSSAIFLALAFPWAPDRPDGEPFGARSGFAANTYYTPFGGFWQDSSGDSSSLGVILFRGYTE